MKAQCTNKVSDVSSTLEKIMNEDQAVREKLDYAFENYGGNSPECILATKKLNATDSVNQKQIDAIFNIHQWLTPPNVSIKASKAYFYVIQHAQHEFQKRYKPHVIEAFEKGIIDTTEFKLFIDRINIREEKYQRHGTQIMTDNLGNNYFVPIDTTQHSTSHFLKEIEQQFQNKDFILFSNHNFTTLFVHAFNPATNAPTPSLDIYLDDQKIGKTNSKGFFQTLIARKTGESTLTIVDANTGKKQSSKLKFQEQVDFFDNYFGFR